MVKLPLYYHYRYSQYGNTKKSATIIIPLPAQLTVTDYVTYLLTSRNGGDIITPLPAQLTVNGYATSLHTRREPQLRHHLYTGYTDHSRTLNKTLPFGALAHLPLSVRPAAACALLRAFCLRLRAARCSGDIFTKRPFTRSRLSARFLRQLYLFMTQIIVRV